MGDPIALHLGSTARQTRLVLAGDPTTARQTRLVLAGGLSTARKVVAGDLSTTRQTRLVVAADLSTARKVVAADLSTARQTRLVVAAVLSTTRQTRLVVAGDLRPRLSGSHGVSSTASSQPPLPVPLPAPTPAAVRTFLVPEPLPARPASVGVHLRLDRGQNDQRRCCSSGKPNACSPREGDHSVRQRHLSGVPGQRQAHGGGSCRVLLHLLPCVLNIRLPQRVCGSNSRGRSRGVARLGLSVRREGGGGGGGGGRGGLGGRGRG